MPKQNKTVPSVVKNIRKNYILYYFLLLVLIIILIYFFVLAPFRSSLAVKYIKSGDQHLLNNEYLLALVDYHKANWLDSKSEASSRVNLANSAQLDYQKQEAFLISSNALEPLEELNQAEKVPANIKAGILQIQDYLGQNKPYLAEVLAQSLVEMDSSDNNTWLYLGISRFQSARIIQMTAEIRKQKLASAKEAFNRSLELDNSEILATKYIQEIDKIM